MGLCTDAKTVAELRNVADKSYMLGRVLYTTASQRLGQAKNGVEATYFQSFMSRLLSFWLPSWKLLYQTTREAIQNRPAAEAFTPNMYTQGMWQTPPDGWDAKKYGAWAPIQDRAQLCSAMTALRVQETETLLPFWKLTSDELTLLNGLVSQYDMAAREPPPKPTMAATSASFPLARSKVGLIAGGVVGVVALSALLYLALRH